MRAIVVEPGEGPDLVVVKEVPMPVPRSGEVLVRMEAAPINPSDLGVLTGNYGAIKNPPFIPGFEGSGTVVLNGGGILGWRIMGKRVSTVAGETTDGTWAEYMVTDAKSCIPIPDAVSFENGACAVVNPLTVEMFMDYTTRQKHRAIIHTAAASQLGKMMVRTCQQKRIPLINIVRRPE
jgi:NADPH2:quinone reductase